MPAGQERSENPSLEQIATVFKAVADPTRLRLLGLIVDRGRCGQDLASVLGLSAPTVSHHLRVLREAGLLSESREGPYRFYGLELSALHRAARCLSDKRRVKSFAADAGLPDEERKVLRNFFEGSRLVALPTQRKKKKFVLEELLRRLPRRKEYDERELSRFIEAMHSDFCSIRREFIMCRYMERDAGRYRLTDKGRAVLERRAIVSS